jgi:hypothetical protein
MKTLANLNPKRKPNGVQAVRSSAVLGCIIVNLSSMAEVQ